MEIQEIFINNIPSDQIIKMAIKKQKKEKILTIFNTIKNRNINNETKRDIYLYHLNIKFTIIEIESSDQALKPKISVIECHDPDLCVILLNEIENFKNKNFDFDDDENILIIFIYNLNDIIAEFLTDQDECNDENNEIINITQKEIDAFKIFYDWEKTIEEKIPINHLFNEQNENKFVNLVLNNLRDVVNWDFNFEQNINIYFNYINRSWNGYTSIDLFFNNDRKKIINYNNISILSDDIKFKNNSDSNLSTKDKNILDGNKKIKFSNFINNNCDLNDNKDNSNSESKKVSNSRQEYFYKYVSKIKENKDQKENNLLLIDILKQINFYMKQLINEKIKVLKELFKSNILNILIFLDQQLKFEFLFICLIPLSNIIFPELIKEKDNNNKKLNEEQNIQNNSFSEKSNSDNFENEIVGENNQIERKINKRSTSHSPKKKF